MIQQTQKLQKKKIIERETPFLLKNDFFFKKGIFSCLESRRRSKEKRRRRRSR